MYQASLELDVKYASEAWAWFADEALFAEDDSYPEFEQRVQAVENLIPQIEAEVATLVDMAPSTHSKEQYLAQLLAATQLYDLYLHRTLEAKIVESNFQAYFFRVRRGEDLSQRLAATPYHFDGLDVGLTQLQSAQHNHAFNKVNESLENLDGDLETAEAAIWASAISAGGAAGALYLASALAGSSLAVTASAIANSSIGQAAGWAVGVGVPLSIYEENYQEGLRGWELAAATAADATGYTTTIQSFFLIDPTKNEGEEGYKVELSPFERGAGMVLGPLELVMTLTGAAVAVNSGVKTATQIGETVTVNITDAIKASQRAKASKLLNVIDDVSTGHVIEFIDDIPVIRTEVNGQKFTVSLKGVPHHGILEVKDEVRTLLTSNEYCFARDTLVSTETGLRPIGEIKPGEKVKSYDFETGQWMLRPVTERMDNNYTGPVLTIEAGNSKIEATIHHPFWVIKGHELNLRPSPRNFSPDEDQGRSLPGKWVNSHELMVGDVIVASDGERYPITAISQRYETAFAVSNLTIGDHHNYAAGPNSFLVHNDSICANGESWLRTLLDDGHASVDEVRSVLFDWPEGQGFDNAIEAFTRLVPDVNAAAMTNGHDYERAIRGLFGEASFTERSFDAVVDGQIVSRVADNVAEIGGVRTAFEAKWTGGWSNSPFNPSSSVGQLPFAVEEQQRLLQQAFSYSEVFAHTVYHTNSIDLLQHYSNLFLQNGITNITFILKT